jgi:hexokinase
MSSCSHPRDPAALFSMAAGALGRQRDLFAEQIREGLAADGQTVAGHPAWLPRPRAGLSGRALVVDIGGTHVRAALVRLRGDGGLELVAGPLSAPVPGVGDPSVTREAFFDAQAALVAQLEPEQGLPLGYCFSYPARVLPSGDAELVRWTKDIRVAGVQGRAVGSLLRQALERAGIRIGAVRVLNDTVAALLAGAMQPGAADFAHGIGLVVGTGSNMAAFFPPGADNKLPENEGGVSMAVNLESGNLQLAELTGWDLELDVASDNPGRQAFEKAVSGRYLPRLFVLAAGDPSACDPDQGAGALVALREQGPAELATLAAAVLDRSADLVACGLAAVLDCLPPGRCQVAAEGGLFWKAPGYADRVRSTLGALLGSDDRVLIVHIDDANLAGAAAAALGPGWAPGAR